MMNEGLFERKEVATAQQIRDEERERGRVLQKTERREDRIVGELERPELDFIRR